MNPKESKENDGKVTCPYCHKKFKHLAMHKPHCPSKPDDKKDLKYNEKQLSTDDTDDKNDGKVACPDSHQMVKPLLEHCRPTDEDKEDLKNNEKQLSTDDTDDKNDGKVACPYCHKKFKRLAMHKPHCPSKPDDKKDLKYNEKQLSTDDTDDKNDGKVACPDSHQMVNICQYCGVSFEAIAIHQAKCEAKPCHHGNKSFEKLTNSLIVKRNQIDIKNINDAMERIKLQLNYKTNKGNSLCWNILNSGSYYSRVKVTKPDEFDFMFCPTRVQCRIELDTEHPCYCKVFITNKDELPEGFSDLLESSGEIIPSKYKKFCFEKFDPIIQDKIRFKRIENDTASPAYTVQYNEGTNKDCVPVIDWVPCLKVETMPEFWGEWKTRKLTDEEKSDAGIYVVAKDLLEDDKLYDLWRLSFSTLEKKIIREKCKNEDHQVIRCIKKILEEVKDDNSKLCSYHIVTHCLHCFEEIKEKPDFKEYTINVMNLLIDRLKSRSLPHFFIPKFNLLREVSQKECEQFIEKLDFYKNEWTKE